MASKIIGYQKRNERFFMGHETGGWDYVEIPYTEENLRRIQLLESFGAVQGIIIE
ncbi:MAG: hypothetical protein HFJ42_09470 [Clostridia bacterium]|nr:hypothetical protein [Clostridia bacterium]